MVLSNFMERYSEYSPAAFKASRWVMFNEVVIDLFLAGRLPASVGAVLLLRT